MAQTSSRRERRAEERRQQILEAAARVFADKGYHRATTREIAEAADLAEGTIYNYFAGKDDLLMALVGQMAELPERDALYSQSVDRDPGEFFVEHFAQRMMQIEPNYRLLVAMLPEILHHPPLRERYVSELMQPAIAMMERHVRARIENGQLRPVNAALTARTIVALMAGMQVLMLFDDPVTIESWQRPEELAQLITSLFLDGLRPRE